MKKIKTILLLAIFGLSISFTSCGDSDDNSCYIEFLQELLLEVQEAANLYTADINSNSRCINYLNAMEDFLDAAEDCSDLSPNIQAQVNSIRLQLESLPCN